MITSSFPPQSAVGGLRPAMFAKYLPRFGWNPTVLTGAFPIDDPQYHLGMVIAGLSDSTRVVESIWGLKDPANYIRSRGIFSKVESFFWPDYRQPPGFIDNMIKTFDENLFSEKFHVIYATSPDLSCLTVGSSLSKKLNVPWVADFRDIAEQDMIKGLRQNIYFKRIIYRRNQIIKTSSRVITVSKHHANVLENSLNRHIDVVYNGYDPEEFHYSPPSISNKFKITYMGRILNEWTRNPNVLFEGLDKLLHNKLIDEKLFEMNFFGTEKDLVDKLSQKYYCKKFIKVLPRVGYDKVPEILRDSNVNIVLTNKGRDGILTTKLFEYIGVGKPFICTPIGCDELKQIVDISKIGFTCEKPEDIYVIIKEIYEKWRKHDNALIKTSDEIKIFSRKYQTGIFAGILNEVVNRQTSSVC